MLVPPLSFRCNVCTFGFEPNPEHSERLDKVQAKLRAHGVGVHIFKKAAYTSYTRLQFATGKQGGREQAPTPPAPRVPGLPPLTHPPLASHPSPTHPPSPPPLTPHPPSLSPLTRPPLIPR